MKRVLIVAFTCLLLMGSIGCYYEIEKNRNNLNLIEIGMSKDEVVKIMGAPYKRECYKNKTNSNIDILLYLTEYTSGDVFDSHITPVVFQDSELVGWGRNFYDDTLRMELKHKIEVNSSE